MSGTGSEVGGGGFPGARDSRADEADGVRGRAGARQSGRAVAGAVTAPTNGGKVASEFGRADDWRLRIAGRDCSWRHGGRVPRQSEAAESVGGAQNDSGGEPRFGGRRQAVLCRGGGGGSVGASGNRADL